MHLLQFLSQNSRWEQSSSEVRSEFSPNAQAGDPYSRDLSSIRTHFGLVWFLLWSTDIKKKSVFWLLPCSNLHTGMTTAPV